MQVLFVFKLRYHTAFWLYIGHHDIGNKKNIGIALINPVSNTTPAPINTVMQVWMIIPEEQSPSHPLHN